jgi:hypothetical protein
MKMCELLCEASLLFDCCNNAKSIYNYTKPEVKK